MLQDAMAPKKYTDLPRPTLDESVPKETEIFANDRYIDTATKIIIK